MELWENDSIMEKDKLMKNLTAEASLISRHQKEALNNQKAFVIWLTGLSGSGKSTIARHLEVSLFKRGIRTLILDGDNTRMSINRDLDFSVGGRSENIRRVAEVAKLLNDAGVVVITAFISPFADDRDLAKKIIGADSFVEVFVDAPLALCIERDVKGLYKKALNGEVDNFTGIDSPYEVPKNSDFTVNTDQYNPDENVKQIMNWFLKIKLIGQKELNANKVI